MKKLIILGLLLLSLTGCVRYDLAIDFPQQHHGTITQNITLAKELTTLSTKETDELITSIEQQAKRLQGKVKRISPVEVSVSIPFNNGKDLASKFNRFFEMQSRGITDILQIKSDLSLQQSNWLLVERNHLSLQVDLTPLGVLSNQGNVLVSSGSFVNLGFTLNVPWGVREIKADNALLQGTTWQLQPGKVNYIEVVFWVPSYLGMGFVGIIVLLSVVGILTLPRLKTRDS